MKYFLISTLLVLIISNTLCLRKSRLSQDDILILTPGSTVAIGTTPAAGGTIIAPSTNSASRIGADTLMLERNSTIGDFLVDGDGRTLYVFEGDLPDESFCYEECQKNFTPFVPINDKLPDAEEGAFENLIGVITRKDNTTQLVYNHLPLYRFIGDKKPGDMLGLSIMEGGKAFFLLQGDGTFFESSLEDDIDDMDDEDEDDEDNMNPMFNLFPDIAISRIVIVPGLNMTTPAEKQPYVIISKKDEQHGDYLTDRFGYTIYVYSLDKPGVSNCFDKCLDTWLPLIIPRGAHLFVAGLVQEPLIGAILRKDGKMQVTYASRPLYYYVEDKDAGSILGNEKKEGIGAFSLINDLGQPIIPMIPVVPVV